MRDKGNCNLFIKKVETELFINYVYSSTLRGNKFFQSHFPREVIYVKKEVTVDLDFFLHKIF